MFSIPHPVRCQSLELLDIPGPVRDDLPANLADIRRLNRWFGGASLVRRYVARVCPPRSAPDRPGAHREPVTILDVATGSADIPVALLRWGRRHNVKLHATGVDLSPDVLAEASRFVGREPVELVLADARALPWPDRSFDLVTCSLALHHFDPQAAEEAVREMVRLARRAVIITDLRRSYVSYTATWLVTRIVARNRLTKHDGPLSVLRAYTPHELRTIAEAAGASPAHIRRHRFFRQVLVYRPEQPHA